MKSHIPSPEDPTGEKDWGAETANRYYYQWTYAAILCCAVLDESRDIQEVFCEQHEDLLLKHRDGTFTGLQVKTRFESPDPWKANDEDVVSSLGRFAALDQEYAGAFRAFVLSTNRGFGKGKKNSNCLPHVLALAQSAEDGMPLPADLQRAIARIAGASGCSAEACLAALRKTRLDDGLPDQNDIRLRLLHSLMSVSPRVGECTTSAALDVCRRLIAECGESSSLGHLQALPGYLGAIANPAEELRTRVEGKRWDRSRTERLVNAAIDAPELLGDPESMPPAANVCVTRLERKLDAGGFSVVAIVSAKDLRNSAEHLALGWLSRFGRREGLRRYTHVQRVVLRDCADAYDESLGGESPFGRGMLEKARLRFRQRIDEGRTPLFDCLEEHLEGFGYVLTNQCKVWWSAPFELEDDGPRSVVGAP